MAFEGLDELAGLGIPEFERFVRARRKSEAAIGGEGDRQHVLGMSLESFEKLARPGIPEL